MKKYVCPICSYVHEGSEPPEKCPQCRLPGSKFSVSDDQCVSSNYSIGDSPKIICPYCKSSNTKKISNLSKAGNVALFGLFAVGKVSKQWHCNNCKSDF